LLHRYDLSAQKEAGPPLTLGDTSTFDGAEGDVSLMGWDVSRDGTKLAYQQTSVSAAAIGPVAITSTFFAANVDGSRATLILDGATANSPVHLSISPNGQLVAVTNAEPSPTVLSGSISGGPAHYYQPDALGPPVWLANSSAFEADNPLTTNSNSIDLYPLNTSGGRAPGSVAHANATSPATLP
jgi:hypothetical protein